MSFEALFLAAIGGVVEAIAGKTIEAGPALARRARMLNIVEQQALGPAEEAVRAAVKAARQELLETYAYTEDALRPGDVQDLVALLNHPPFAEELSRVLLFRGQADFDRLRSVYLAAKSEDGRSARWAALEPYLVELFESVEQHLLADPTLGPLLRDLRKLTVLLRMAGDVHLIADASRNVAEATRQMLPLQGRTAEAAESAAGDLSRMAQLAGQRNATLRQVVGLLHALVARLDVPGPGDASTSATLRPREVTYLRLLRRECNRLPLA
ncbi:MAG TPA: hypothetical protein ENJ31_11560, partial [Anaerolineae bacterium]|nr:hypothetical protein [Anaerolineae bacterium]